MADDLYLEREGEIATLVFNRPDKRNAITHDMYQRLPELVDEFDTDPGVKVLVIRGAGEQAFCAGADIGEFGTVRADSARAKVYNESVHAAEMTLAGTNKPTIAMVHGHCIGGGCGVALACDFRFSGTSGRFGITPAKLGLVYSLESSRRLVDLVGPSHAKYILLSGRAFDATRALETGLVNELHDDELLAAETYRFAEDLCTRAQFTVRSMKQIVRRIGEGQAFDDDDTRDLRNSSFDTDDYHEGVAAFMEKRPPRFTYS